MASTREGGGITTEGGMMTEQDYEAMRARVDDIECEIETALEKAWGGEAPPDGDWRKQTEMTNQLLLRAIVLLEGITDQLQAKWDER